MVNDIKIALCLSGAVRNSIFCFPYIYDSFLNTSYNVDVFINTWGHSRVIDLYKPKKYSLNSQKETLENVIPQLKLSDDVKIEGNMGHNILMFSSLKRCFDLVEPDYNIVIRCRFDLLLQDKINLPVIVNNIIENKYDMFIPGTSFNMGGYNDQLAIGNYKSMKIYSDCISQVNFLANKIKRWHPESLLGEHLKSNDIIIEQDDYDYRITRNVNVVLSWPENPYKFLNL